MLTQKQISQIGFRKYTNIQFSPNGSGIGAWLDSDIVLPNKHWIVTAASLFMFANANNNQLGGVGIGGPLTGIFICPPGTKRPLNGGGSSITPFRCPMATDYPFNIDQYTFWNTGPTYLPVGVGDDNTAVSGETPVGSIAAIFSQGPFYVPANSFVRGFVASSTNGLNVNDINAVLNLQIIEEDNC
jgi:hypothetical protein